MVGVGFRFLDSAELVLVIDGPEEGGIGDGEGLIGLGVGDREVDALVGISGEEGFDFGCGGFGGIYELGVSGFGEVGLGEGGGPESEFIDFEAVDDGLGSDGIGFGLVDI